MTGFDCKMSNYEKGGDGIYICKKDEDMEYSNCKKELGMAFTNCKKMSPPPRPLFQNRWMEHPSIKKDGDAI